MCQVGVECCLPTVFHGGAISLAETTVQFGGFYVSNFVETGLQGMVQGASGPSAGLHGAGGEIHG